MDPAVWGLLSEIVTVVGLPFAVVVFILQQRKQRENEEEAVYELLSENYQDFLKVALENADLKLFAEDATPDLSDEQRQRMIIIFSMLVSLFERAYLLLYEKHMSHKQKRLWLSWEDYMREWCMRSDFKEMLPQLLFGEDDDFQKYIRSLAKVCNPC
jgi:hypothetical protein